MKDEVFEKEQEHLTQTYNKLKSVISELEGEVANPSEIAPSKHINKDEISFLLQQQEIHRDSKIHAYQKIEKYKKVLNEVYFSRIDIDYETHVKTYYISKEGLHFLDTIDWRSDIGALMYDQTTRKYNESFDIVLKRRFNIKRDTLVEYKNIIAKDIGKTRDIDDVSDEFLIEVLRQKKDDHTITDIIKSIQTKQNEIIRLPVSYNITVLGCAGSGKTMILFHRLSYLKFHNQIKWNKVKIITPNNDLNKAFKQLKTDLGLSEIKMMTYTDYFKDKLKYFGYNLIDENVRNENTINSDVLSVIYSKETQSNLFKKYSNHLNLFVNKIKKVLNDKDYIRQFNNFNNNPIKIYRHLKENKDKLNKDIDLESSKISKLVLEKENKINKFLTNIIKLNEIKIDKTFEIDNEKDYRVYQVKEVLSTHKTLNLQYISDEKYKQIEHSYLYELDLKKFLQPIEKSVIMFSRYLEEANDLNNNYTKIEMQVNDVKATLTKALSKLSQLRQDRLNCRFYQLNKKRFIDKKISSLESKSNNLKQTLETKQEDIGKLKFTIIELNIKLNNITKNSGINKTNLNAYKMYVYTLKELIDLHKGIKGINEDVTIKKELLSVRKEYDEKINEIIDLKIWFDNNFVLDYLTNIIFPKNTSITLQKMKYHFYYYYLLLFISTFYSNEKAYKYKDTLICIDEFQDISPNEIQLIKEINDYEVVINQFGDLCQRLLVKGIKNQDELPKNHHVYHLENNYRNTNQITRFYNTQLNKNDVPVGINGPIVENVNLNDVINLYDKSKTNAFVCHNTKKRYIKKTLKDIEDIYILSVYEAKGLEFNTVFVYEKDMSTNEKYISYSRALHKLYIINE